MSRITYCDHEKTRLLGTRQGDLHLCKPHAEARLAKGESLGVAARSMAIMMGMAAWPTGQEACDDCGKAPS